MNTLHSLQLLAMTAALASSSALAQLVPDPTDIHVPDIGLDPVFIPVRTPVMDWSDAPMGGAAHTLIPGFQLGTMIDGEWAAITTLAADGDDLTGVPDDDGVLFPPLVRGTWVNIQVAAPAGGLLDAWIDFNRVGGFQPAERIAGGVPLAPGVNIIPVFIPPGIPAGAAYARFRLSSVGGLPPIGFAPNGEVEDYRVPIL